MAILAGEIVTAARLNRMQPVPYRAACTSQLTLTTSEQDVTGASITFTTSAANAVYLAEADVLFSVTTGGAATCQCRINIDGTSETSPEAEFSGATTGALATASQQWRGTLASAGSHTIKLRGLKSANVGTQVIGASHTVLTVTVYEVV